MLLIGQTGAIVFNYDIEVVAATTHGNRDVPVFPAFKTMFHGIGDQLGQHQRQRRGILRRHHAESADEIDVDVLVAHGGQIHSHLQQTGNNLVVVHDLIGGLAQAFMDHGDGLHAALRLFQLFLDFFGLGFTCLQP